MTILKWLAFPFVFLAHKLWEVSIFLVIFAVAVTLVVAAVALCAIAFINLAPDSIYTLWVGTGRFFPFLDLNEMVMTGAFGIICLVCVSFVFMAIGGFFSWIGNNIKKTKRTLGL